MASDPKPTLDMVSIFSKFVSALPEGSALTGFTFEVTSKIGDKHLIRCNGGTYKELLAEFTGTEEDFVKELIEGYKKSAAVAIEKFTPIVQEEERDSKGNLQ